MDRARPLHDRSMVPGRYACQAVTVAGWEGVRKPPETSTTHRNKFHWVRMQLSRGTYFVIISLRSWWLSLRFCVILVLVHNAVRLNQVLARTTRPSRFPTLANSHYARRIAATLLSVLTLFVLRATLSMKPGRKKDTNGFIIFTPRVAMLLPCAI